MSIIIFIYIISVLTYITVIWNSSLALIAVLKLNDCKECETQKILAYNCYVIHVQVLSICDWKVFYYDFGLYKIVINHSLSMITKTFTG